MSLMDVRVSASRGEAGGEWPDFNDAGRRAQLTPAAVKAVVKLGDKWNLPVKQIGDLMGGISSSTWHAWKTKPPKEMSVDQLTRVSLLLGMYAALHALHPGPLADEWPSRPNSNPLFHGRTPVQAMIDGGIPAMVQVRALLDGRRGGL